MKIRTISSVVYVAILLVFYLLKLFVHDLCFDVLTYAFALIGTVEILRTLKEKTTKAQRIIIMLFAITVIPACALMEYFFRYGLHVTSILFFAVSVALVSLLVIRYEETTPENLGTSFFAAVYPVLLLCTLIINNHVSNPIAMEHYPKALAEVAFNSDLLILFIFVVSPCADSFAYLFGRFFGKSFPQKMAPAISPNKTIIGAIGGFIGGMLGAAAIYFFYNAVFVGEFIHMHIWLPTYLAIGLLAAMATAFGDLVESSFKRKMGIKDMGKLIPGHGGIMDRIDGTLFASMVIQLIFALIRLLAM